MRQFLVESLLLSLIGGACGLGLAYLSADALNLLSQRVLPRADGHPHRPAVLLFSLRVATVTGLLLGLAPAAHGIAVDVHAGLKDGDALGVRRPRPQPAAGGAGRRGSRVVAGAARRRRLMVKSMYQLLHVQAGFDADGVLTLQLNLPPQKYVDRELERQFSPLATRAATRSSPMSSIACARVPGASPSARSTGCR